MNGRSFKLRESRVAIGTGGLSAKMLASMKMRILGHLCRVSQPWGAADFLLTPKLALIASQAEVSVSVK